MSATQKSVVNWVKDNAWSILTAIVVAAATYGVVKTEFRHYQNLTIDNKADLAKHEERLVQIDRTLDNVRYVQANNVSRLDRAESESRSTQKDVSDIKAQLGVLTSKLEGTEKKLDQVIELLKKQKGE